MGQYIEKYKKNIVIDMRKRGYSYSEIQNSIHVPKSTIAVWLKDTKLTKVQAEKLKIKQLKTAKSNSEKRKLKTLELIENIKKTSSRDIKGISKKELWLMGIMLYWKESLLLKDSSDIKKGINFTSSDPYLVKLFLKWLHEVGCIDDSEIKFDIFIYQDNFRKLAVSKSEDSRVSIKEIINYWAEVVNAPEDSFKRIYFKKPSVKGRERKSKLKTKKRNHPYGKTQFGLLRIRVKASSMLVRQISGWMNGIRKTLLES